MSDTPNEIWCGASLYWDYKKDWSEGSWLNNDNCGGVKYIRADRIKELEAKLAKAVEALEHAKFNMPHPDQMIDDTLAKLKGNADGRPE